MSGPHRPFDPSELRTRVSPNPPPRSSLTHSAPHESSSTGGQRGHPPDRGLRGPSHGCDRPRPAPRAVVSGGSACAAGDRAPSSSPSTTPGGSPPLRPAVRRPGAGPRLRPRHSHCGWLAGRCRRHRGRGPVQRKCAPAPSVQPLPTALPTPDVQATRAAPIAVATALRQPPAPPSRPRPPNRPRPPSPPNAGARRDPRTHRRQQRTRGRWRDRVER